MSCLEELVCGAAGHHHNGAHAAGPACSGLASLVCWCCSSPEVRVFLWYACFFTWLKRCKPLEDGGPQSSCCADSAQQQHAQVSICCLLSSESGGG